MCLYVWVYESCDVKDEVEFDEDDGDEDIRGRDIFCRTEALGLFQCPLRGLTALPATLGHMWPANP